MKLSFETFDLPLRHPFGISRSTVDHQRTLVVSLHQDDQTGYGEAVASSYYGASIEGMTAILRQLRPRLEVLDWEDPIDFWETVHCVLGGMQTFGTPSDATFVLSALDTASYDLWGKLQGKPLWKLWGLSLEGLPPSSYTIGLDTIEVMVDKLREFPDWPVYKIKLGRPDDLEIVRQLRRHTDAIFRVDANGAWAAEEMLPAAEELKELGVELIEQPLSPGEREEMKSLIDRSPLPLLADESCRGIEEVEHCAGCFHGINIKLVKCGGLTPGRRMIQRARELDMKVMIGCFTESSVGISAAAQLLPLVDYADLDGALLLARDVATGVTVDHGQVIFPEEDGCGIRLRG